MVPASAPRGAGRLGRTTLDPVAVPVPEPRIPADVVPLIRRVIPDWLWISLAGAVLLAAIGLVAALRNRARIRRQQAQVVGLTEAALTDALTGLLNRRGFLDEAERELARARRHDRPFTLAYADVRGLKRVNDSLGHQEGDRLLRTVAQMLRASARAGDAVGRLGGDELGLLLVEQGGEGAAAVQRRIHALVDEKRDSLHLGSDWDVTIGLASFPVDGVTIPGLLACADRRLYDQRGIHVRDQVGAA